MIEMKSNAVMVPCRSLWRRYTALSDAGKAVNSVTAEPSFMTCTIEAAAFARILLCILSTEKFWARLLDGVNLSLCGHFSPVSKMATCSS